MADLIFPNGTKLSELAPNTGNLLAAITPTFAGFSTNPGTNANLVNELTIALTTSGILTDSIWGNIIYDLGAVKRFVGFGYSVFSYPRVYQLVSLSTDGSTYHNIEYVANNSISFAGSARYIKLGWIQFSGGNVDITSLSTRVYLV